MTTIPINAPRCCGACAQGRNECDCGVGAPSACDLKRLASDNFRREIDGPYRAPRKPLLPRIFFFFWSKA